MDIRKKTVVAMVLALAISGCGKKPGGQVIATVDGTEITRRDLASELQAAGGKNADDLKRLQPQLIESIINRKLLVEEAKRQKLDQNPQYLAAQQRQQEVLLGQMLAQSWKMTPKTPSNAEVQAFIDKNPQMFAQRKVLLADDITTALTSITSAELAKLNTNDQIAAYLTANKKPFQRGRKTIDTAQLPLTLANDLVGRVGKDPIAIRGDGSYSIAAIQAARDVTVPADQQFRGAKVALMNKTVMDDAQARLKQLRAAADITYLPEFAPATDKAAAPAPAANAN